MDPDNRAGRYHEGSGNTRGGASADAIFDAWVERINAGEPFDRAGFAASHPDLPTEIADHLEILAGLESPDLGDEPLGTLGDFILCRRIGRGGMGVVYEAWESSMNRPVALKVLPAAVAADTRAVTRFIREAQLAGKLSHPNVVAVHGMGVKDETPYYAMEYVEGRPLSKLIADLWADPPVTGAAGTFLGLRPDEQPFYFQLARAFADVADGLQHAHSRGIVHRDIKPSNLILDSDPGPPGGSPGPASDGSTVRLRILDFGLARLEGQEALTRSGDLLGTLLYMSPEQARRQRIAVDHRTDIYSLGATLYEALTGQPPFRGQDQQDTLSRIMEREPPAPTRINSRVPRDLETIVLKCLRKAPADRYGTAEALAQDLRRFVRGDAIEARPPTRLEEIARRLRRHRLRIAVVSSLALLTVTCAFLFLRWQEVDLKRRELEVETRSLQDLAYDRAIRTAVARIVRAERLLRAGRGATSIIDTGWFVDVTEYRTLLAGDGEDPLEVTVELLSEASARRPDRFEAYYYLARAHDDLGRRAEAALFAREALERAPSFAPARLLAASPSSLEERREVLRSLREEFGRGSWGRIWIDATLAALDRDWQSAVTSYSQLVRLAPDEREMGIGGRLEHQLGLGVALLESGRHRDAAEEFRAVSSLWPTLIAPVLLRARAYHLDGEEARAGEILTALYDRQGTDGERDEVAVWIALAHRSISDHDRALAWAQKITDPLLHLRLEAASLSKLARDGEAEAAARRALELAPSSPADRLNLANIVLSRNWDMSGDRLPAALPEIFRLTRSVAPRFPGRPNVQRFWGLVQGLVAWKGTDLGPEAPGFEEALASCRMALSLDGGQEWSHIIHGLVLGFAGRVPEARDAFERAIAVEPDSPVGHVLLGVFHQFLGEFAKALRAYREARSPARRRASDWLGLGNAALLADRMGERDEAIALLDEFTRRRPARTWPYSILAGWTMDRGEWQRALDTLAKLLALRPGHRGASKRLLALLLECDEVDALRGLDGVAAAIAPDDMELMSDRISPERLAACALLGVLRTTGIDGDGRGREAVDLALRALEISGPTDLRVAEAAARVFRAVGDSRQAVLTLEQALARRRSPLPLQELLESCRGDLELPVSLASVDARFESSGTPATLPALLARWPEPPPETAGRDDAVRSYLRARLLEREGRRGEALEILDGLIASSGEPVRALESALRCIDSSGGEDGALRRLSAVATRTLAPEEPLRGAEERALWRLWTARDMNDPQTTRRGGELIGAPLRDALARRTALGERSYAGDLLWLVGELEAGRPLRINCGGEAFKDREGHPWRADAFYAAGAVRTRQSDEGPPDPPTLEPLLHRTHRWFVNREVIDAGYLVPLPVGEYEVTLHFVESYRLAPGQRVFDIALERKVVVAGHDPFLRGYKIPHTESRRVRIEDGVLEIGFRARAGVAEVAGIEIRRLE